MSTEEPNLPIVLAEVNQRIFEVAQSADGVMEWEFYCECEDQFCGARVSLSLPEYVAIRKSSGRILVRGHSAAPR